MARAPPLSPEGLEAKRLEAQVPLVLSVLGQLGFIWGRLRSVGCRLGFGSLCFGPWVETLVWMHGSGKGDRAPPPSGAICRLPGRRRSKAQFRAAAVCIMPWGQAF